jgi:hypothetical protein
MDTVPWEREPERSSSYKSMVNRALYRILLLDGLTGVLCYRRQYGYDMYAQHGDGDLALSICPKEKDGFRLSCGVIAESGSGKRLISSSHSTWKRPTSLV